MTATPQKLLPRMCSFSPHEVKEGDAIVVAEVDMIQALLLAATRVVATTIFQAVPQEEEQGTLSHFNFTFLIK